MLNQLYNALDMLDLTTVLTFLLVLIVSYIIWNYFFTVQRVDIPGPTPWPIVGNLPHIAGARDIGKRLLEFRKTYGDMVFLRFGPQPILVCFGYKLVREVLLVNGEKTKFRPSWMYLIKKFFPKVTGIFFSDGKTWSDGRKFTIVALKDFGVGKKTIDERIHEEVQYLVDEFSKNPEKPVDVLKVFPMATSNIISNIVFGSRFDYDDKEFKEMLYHIYFIFKSATIGAPENFFPIIDKLKPWNTNSQVAGHMAAVRTYMRSRVDKERDSFDPNNIRNFIDLYLEQEGKPDSKISEDFLFQAIVDIYQAGTDTTAVTLAWCMLYMLKYPEVQKKCRDEVMKVIGDGRFPSSKDKVSLPYVMATIHEVQRLAAVAPVATPHATLEDTYIDGKLVPKHTVILCHLMSVLYDPNEWQEPEKFQPERFLGEKGELIKHEAFCPFSMGPRTCIGQQLASNEVFLFFTSFLQRFNFTTVNKDDCVSTDGEQTGVTRQPYPFEMCFKPI